MSTLFSKNDSTSLKESYSQKFYIVLMICLALAIGFQLGKNTDRKKEFGEHSIELVQDNSHPEEENGVNDFQEGREKADVLAAVMVRKNFTVPSGVDLNRLISSEEKNSNPSDSKKNSGDNFSPEKCPFVASKNSNKYHRADCPTVARIKKENRICFSSEEQAQSENYTLANDCTKQ